MEAAGFAFAYTLFGGVIGEAGPGIPRLTFESRSFQE